MKSIANLYLQELKPNREWLTLQRFVTYVGGLLVVFIVIWATLTALQSQQQKKLVAHIEQGNALQAELQVKQRALDEALNDSQLNGELDALDRQVRLRYELMAQLQQVTGKNQTSFSQLLADLARVDTSAIWLHRILLQDDALTLQGRTIEPQQLPSWLASFSQYEALQQRPFGVFELRAEEAPGLVFTVGHLEHRQTMNVTAGGAR